MVGQLFKESTNKQKKGNPDGNFDHSFCSVDVVVWVSVFCSCSYRQLCSLVGTCHIGRNKSDLLTYDLRPFFFKYRASANRDCTIWPHSCGAFAYPVEPHPMTKLSIPRVGKKFVVCFLLASILHHQHVAYSQVLPVAPAANFVMNRAIGGVLTRVAIARGFAANDPRIAATLVGAGSSLTGVNVAATVAGVGLSIAGAPVWLTVAAGLGVFAVGSVLIAGKTSMSLSNDGLNVNASGTAVPPAYTPPAKTQSYDQWGDFYAALVSIYRLPDCYPSQACYAYPPLPKGNIPYQKNPYVQDTRSGPVAFVYWSLDELNNKYYPVKERSDKYGIFTIKTIIKWSVTPHVERATNGIGRLVGTLSTEVVCFSPASDCAKAIAGGDPQGWGLGPRLRPWNSDDEGLIIAPSELPNTYKSLDAAVQAVPPSSLVEKLAPDTLAKLADQAWMKAAAQPGYQGLPYSATQPVTTDDAVQWQTQNPTAAPTLGDMLTPANNPGTSSVPISQSVTADVPKDPKPDPAAVQNVNVVNAPKVDLGADPNIAAPTLETTPDALQTLYPLITLFPELKNYQTPQHTSECPKPQFNVFGKSFTMDSHCNLVEQNRLAIAAVMAVVWVLVGIFILLSA